MMGRGRAGSLGCLQKVGLEIRSGLGGFDSIAD